MNWRQWGGALAILAICGVLVMSPGFAQDEEAGDPALEAIGGLAVGHMHSSLGFVGVTADAFAKDVYEADTVEELMGGVVGGIDATKKLLRKLQDSELSDEDEQFIDGIIGVYNAISAEAKALVKFAKSEDDTDAKAFEKARQTAVSRLQKLIGNEEEEIK